MYKRDEEKIYKRLKSDYDYLVSLGYEVVGVFLQGSQNYDLDYSGSDIDTKAIVLPNFNDLMMGGKQASTTLILENNEHIDVKDIRLMFNSFLKQNINFLEILFTKYHYMNPEYSVAMREVLEQKEKIAHYDNYKTVNCLVGMMYEKYKALEHPYPATKNKIEKFGYDGKQLHHILRCEEFLNNYINEVSFENSLQSKSAEKLIRIKENKEYNLEEARVVGKEALERAKELKTQYAIDHVSTIDKSVPELLNKVVLKMLTRLCKNKFEEEE